MSDDHIVNKFFQTTNKIDHDANFVDDQWMYLQEATSGVPSTRLSFDTLSLKTQLVDWESAYLLLPLKFSTPGATYPNSPAFNAKNELALKSSVLSLINSVNVNTGSGQSLVNDSSIHLINNIRLLLDESVNWSQTMGAELCYAMDTTNESSFDNVGGGNQGAYKRSQYMLNQSSFPGDNTIIFNAVIPLRYIHSIFPALGMSINTHFQINFGLNFQNTAVNTAAAGVQATNLLNDYAPFTIGTGTIYPTITIGNTSIPGARIYYRNLRMSAEKSRALANKMSEGFKKTICFTVTDKASFLASDSVVGGQVVQKIVSASTVRPIRLIVLPLQKDSLKSVLLPAPFIANGRLTGTQVKINNEYYFKTPMITDYEHWSEVLRSMPGAGIYSQEGSQIDFIDFVGNQTLTSASYRIYAFDIHRIKERMVAPNDAMTINFESTMKNLIDNAVVGSFDMVYLVEREQQIQIDYSNNSVDYTLGITK